MMTAVMVVWLPAEFCSRPTSSGWFSMMYSSERRTPVFLSRKTRNTPSVLGDDRTKRIGNGEDADASLAELADRATLAAGLGEKALISPLSTASGEGRR
jgi:hypothetical protein